MSRRLFLTTLFFSVCVGIAVPPARADMEILVPGGSRTILATYTDTLVTGETIRANFEKVFWFPGASQDEGHLFLNHEIGFPDGGLTRHTYQDGEVTEIEDWAVGTHKNCSGNVSSWGTILSCEEFPPDTLLEVGYIVELDPLVAGAWTRRHAMGRFSHESVIEDPLTGDLYMTDDQNDGVFFKFVADSPGDLSSGSLYALREPTRDWVLVTDMVNTRDQALALGATPRPRPEDLSYNPVDDKIYIAVTGLEGNSDSGFGYLLRFDPRTNLMVRWLDGSADTFANPDNLAVDSLGNLLVQEDKYSGNIDLTGPNRLVLVHLDATTTPIMVGLDTRGEVTGLEWGGSDDRFFLCWQGGAFPDRQQLMEVNLPSGWNELPASAPVGFSLPSLGLHVAPNPSSTASRIRASLAGPGELTLGIYDVGGALIRPLFQGGLDGGVLEILWDGRRVDGREVEPGVYFARARFGDVVATARIVQVR